jgi:hypothetical protein
MQLQPSPRVVSRMRHARHAAQGHRGSGRWHWKDHGVTSDDGLNPSQRTESDPEMLIQYMHILIYWLVVYLQNDGVRQLG